MGYNQTATQRILHNPTRGLYVGNNGWKIVPDIPLICRMHTRIAEHEASTHSFRFKICLIQDNPAFSPCKEPHIHTYIRSQPPLRINPIITIFYLDLRTIEYSIYCLPSTKQGSDNFIPAQPLYDSCCAACVKFTIPSKYSIYLV